MLCFIELILFLRSRKVQRERIGVSVENTGKGVDNNSEDDLKNANLDENLEGNVEEQPRIVARSVALLIALLHEDVPDCRVNSWTKVQRRDQTLHHRGTRPLPIINQMVVVRVIEEHECEYAEVVD